MTALAQEILNTFDRLADAEQLEIRLEILRRFASPMSILSSHSSFYILCNLFNSTSKT